VTRRAALAGLGLLVAAALLAPYAVMLLTALKPEAELRITPPRLLPLEWRPQNFWVVVRDPEFQSWLRVSLVVALTSTALVVLAAVPAAYHTARHRFAGRGAFLFLVLVTQMFAPTALVVGLYREFFVLGLINTLIRPILVLLTLPVTILTLGLFIFVINGLLFWAVGSYISGFHVDGFWAGVFGAIVYSLISWALSALIPKKT